jgi:hypothetical protein
MSAGRGDVLLDQELGAGVRAPLHHEQGLPLPEVLKRQVDLLPGLVLDLGRGQADRGVILKRMPTLGTEPGFGGVAVPASGAIHLDLPSRQETPRLNLDCIPKVEMGSIG